MNDSEQLSLSDLRNIYCVGRNYRLHAAELGNEVPTSPMIFTKPTHAATNLSEGVIAIPGTQGSIHYEAELVFAIGKPYKPGICCDELITSFTVGLDFTLRDVQDRLKAKGQPWLPAKGFRNSATLGRWLNYPGLTAMAEYDFGMRLNGKEAQRGNVRDMVFNLQQIVDFVGQHYGLGPGDILFTGTPEGVGELNDGDKLDVWWNETSLGVATTRLDG